MEEKLLPPPEEEDKYPPFQRYGSIQTRNPTVVSFIESRLNRKERIPVTASYESRDRTASQ